MTLTVDHVDKGPAGRKPTDRKPTKLSLADAAKDFHLFTLGPVYVGATLDVDILQVFQEQERLEFQAIHLELPFPAFDGIGEWNFLIQGIEKKRSPSGAVDNSLAHMLSGFMQGWDFVRRDTQDGIPFYARVYTRPVQIVPPGVMRGVSVETYMLCSNKGTQMLEGANPYEVVVDPQIAPHVKREADAVFSVLET